MHQTAEIDIDRIVDYRKEYSSVIKRAKITGDNLTGLCPFHEDSNNSFSADLKTGQWHCFAEDRGGNFISFWAELHGIDTKEAYKQILAAYGVEQETEEDRKKAEVRRRSYSVSQYAFEKRLPEEWLKSECCVETKKDRDGTTWMKIPYLNADRKEATYRRRYAHKDFRWKAGSSGKICLYGEWRIEAVRAAGSVALVEGESDTQSMWYMSIPCLGVAGASMFKPHQAGILQDLKVYIHQEPDQGGETFLQKVLHGLREGGFIGTAYKWSCGTIPGCKDPSDVFMKFGREEAGKKILHLMKHAEKIDLDAPDAIQESIRGAPVNLRQPEGWIFSDKGISKISEKTYQPQLVCRTPVLLTQRLRNLETGDEKIEVAFKRDGEWRRSIFPRSMVFTARSVTALADLGCTVTSENAKGLVQFLSALEAENIDVIRKADATGTFGWQPGKRFIPGIEEGIVLDVDPSQKGMVSAYCRNGEMDGWIRTMRLHRERDKFRFILAASFAAPLLRIIRQRIFFVYNWGGSKGGKTAALKAALSAWGDPERLMVNFNATQVGLERTASFFCDLPLGIDERQLAGRNQESLEKTIYMIASGTGKIRGAKGGGLQTTHQWRTVALATGEEPLSTETSQTGVSTRVLEIYGGPFDSEEEASLMHQEAPMNCGWTGPEFVKRLVRIDEKKICDKYDEMTAYVHSVAEGKSGSHVAGISAVALADAMLDSWFFSESAQNSYSFVQNGENVPETAEKADENLHISVQSWERAKAMAAAILREQMSEDLGDVNEHAVQFVTDWVLANKLYFGTSKIGTCLGDVSASGDTVWIYPSELNAALTRAGFSPRKTLKYMADTGLIKSQELKGKNGNRYKVSHRFDGRRGWFIEFYLGKIAPAYDALEASEDAASEKHDDKEGFMNVDEYKQEELPFS